MSIITQSVHSSTWSYLASGLVSGGKKMPRVPEPEILLEKSSDK